MTIKKTAFGKALRYKPEPITLSGRDNSQLRAFLAMLWQSYSHSFDASYNLSYVTPKREEGKVQADIYNPTTALPLPEQ